MSAAAEYLPLDLEPTVVPSMSLKKLVPFEDIKKKKYSLSAGQYFDIKIEYVDITEEEFNSRMTKHQQNLQQMFEESHALENDIMEQLKKLKFNG